MIETSAIRDTLGSQFGFDSFREGQERVIQTLLEGRSALAIFPTGAGKSLCYQLPALLLDGVTLVISPLIALMKDQIDFLKSRGIAAARLDSSIDTADAREVYRQIRDRSLKLLYIAPERLANERFLATLGQLVISLMAVDEAHCISEWGHNFRPDYLKLARLARRLKVRRVLALTATATPPVAQQIAKAFAIAEPDVVRTGFYRKNLSLAVTPVDASHRHRLLVERMSKRRRGATIVYVTLQKTAENVAEFLRDKGFDARAYHAGLEAEERHAIQDWFMGRIDAVVVATIAFGMGIDKRDIRYIYHFNLPKSLENYAQEIGRAGRDGVESICEMLACADDTITLGNFTFGDTPTDEAVGGVVKEVLSLGDGFDVSVSDLAHEHDMRPLVVETLLTYLELDNILVATGPFYSEYKFQTTRPLDQVLRQFDPRRAEFLQRVFAHEKRARKWSSLDVHAIAKALNEDRQRIVAALNYLEEKGELILEVAGVRQGYRQVNATGTRDVQSEIRTLIGRFATREKRDIERLDQVMSYASHDGCKTRYLVEYFGEAMDGDCGHCATCRGYRPAALPSASHHAVGQVERAIVKEVKGESHAALATPRQLARFLCGLPSPRASRAKLGKHPQFGALAHVPFAEVLAFVMRQDG